MSNGKGKPVDQRLEPLLIKDLVNFLFDNVLHPDGRPYTTQEVTDHVRISHATINQLRTGRSKNPTLPTLQEIGRFFDVPLSFFDCQTVDECYAVLAERPGVSTGDVAEIAFRASRLTAEKQIAAGHPVVNPDRTRASLETPECRRNDDNGRDGQRAAGWVTAREIKHERSYRPAPYAMKWTARSSSREH
jgi:transcriptional regulator with XRE-family HTH domain